MKCVEIITLRSPSKINGQFIDDLLNGLGAVDWSAYTQDPRVKVKVYHHSAVETDFSIHIHWKSEMEIQGKSPLGQSLSFALKPLGLLNYSVWVETGSRELGTHNAETGSSLGERSTRVPFGRRGQ
jgi:hypothetical protein